jgi:hypothetical protein
MATREEVRSAADTQKERIRKMHRRARWVLVAQCAMVAVGLPLAVLALWLIGASLVSTVALYGVDLGSPWRALYVAAWHVFALSVLATAVSHALGYKSK